MKEKKIITTKKTAKILLGVAIFILLIATIFLLCFPFIFNFLLHKQLSLVNNSMVYGFWKDLPVSIEEHIYFFNITNAEDFLKHGAKLNVTEVGPYMYNGTWTKHEIDWFPNKTVTFKEFRTYDYHPDPTSNRSEDDFIYTLNGPLAMANGFIKDLNRPLRWSISAILGILGEKVIIKKTIKELVYGGYKDILTTVVQKVIPGTPFEHGRFSWLAGKNGTYDGRFTVFTGEDSIEKLNLIDNWNGEKELSYWDGDACNMMNGSNAEVSPPLEGKRQFSFFQSLFCRTFTLDYSEDSSCFDIPTERFIATSKLFASSEINPDNKCFETNKELGSGLQDLSRCQFGAPAVLSFPHFYLAEEKYVQSINGLHPNESLHSTFIDVEPRTGASFNIDLKFQISVELPKKYGLLQYRNVPKGIFPVLWIRVSGTIPEDLAEMIDTKLTLPKIIVYSITGTLIVLCVILIVVSAAILIKFKLSKDDDDDPLLSGDKEKPSRTSNSTYDSFYTAKTSSQNSSSERHIGSSSEQYENADDDLLLDSDAKTGFK